jgi:hypothetical protein
MFLQIVLQNVLSGLADVTTKNIEPTTSSLDISKPLNHMKNQLFHQKIQFVFNFCIQPKKSETPRYKLP